VLFAGQSPESLDCRLLFGFSIVDPSISCLIFIATLSFCPGRKPPRSGPRLRVATVYELTRILTQQAKIHTQTKSISRLVFSLRHFHHACWLRDRTQAFAAQAEASRVPFACLNGARFETTRSPKKKYHMHPIEVVWTRFNDLHSLVVTSRTDVSFKMHDNYSPLADKHLLLGARIPRTLRRPVPSQPEKIFRAHPATQCELFPIRGVE
jgi:hypothetical protein